MHLSYTSYTGKNEVQRLDSVSATAAMIKAKSGYRNTQIICIKVSHQYLCFYDLFNVYSVRIMYSRYTLKKIIFNFLLVMRQ
jgi:hypothetical protein